MPDDSTESGGRILVCPLSHVPALVASRGPARVISLLDPGVGFPELGDAYASRHLRLSFHDTHFDAVGITAPSAEHIDRLLAFLDEWAEGDSLLIHCRAGIGRSTATAFVAACRRNPDVSERVIAAALRAAAPLSRPNEVIVALADERMGRGGRMYAAIADTGRGLPWLTVSEGEPFELPAKF